MNIIVRPVRIAVLIAAAFVLASTSTVRAELATADEARAVAENWAALIVHLKGHWGGCTTPMVGQIQEIRRNQRLLGYACPVEPDGFIVVSVCKQLAPVKAYSTIHDLDLTSDEGFADLIKSTMERTLRALESAVGPLESAADTDIREVLESDYGRVWEALEADPADFRRRLGTNGTRTNYAGGEVLLSTNWHQGEPYNDQCPYGDCNYPCSYNDNYLVGCVAVAGAQTMRYWSWPPYGEGSPYDDVYDWPNMPNALEFDIACVPLFTQVEVDAVAELCAEVGTAVDMDYGCSGSAACLGECVGADLRDAFEENFRYPFADRVDRDEYDSDVEWFEAMKFQLNINRPLPYRNDGHAFVADGWEEIALGGDTDRKYHMNWGHANSMTAWYDLGQIPNGGVDVEAMLVSVVPGHSMGPTPFGDYYPGPLPYRYFDQDALCYYSHTIFHPGLMLQFLPTVTVTSYPGLGLFVLFDGSSEANTRLFVDGDPSRGIRIQDGGIRLTNYGSICLVPLTPPRLLRAEAVVSIVIVRWEDGLGDQDAFVIERSVGPSGVFAYLATTSEHQYVDEMLTPGQLHTYRVRAVRDDGVASDYSNEAEAQVPPR